MSKDESASPSAHENDITNSNDKGCYKSWQG